MGSGRPRSNVEPVSAGRQVITDDGRAILGCVVDESIPANVEPGTGENQDVGQLGTADDGTLWLYLAGHPVALLLPGEQTDRLSACMRRGHRYNGTVVGPDLVRVWNAL